MNEPQKKPDFDFKYMKISDKAIDPSKAHPTDLGWDLYALENVIIPSLSVQLVRTGIAFQFPPGVGGILKDRSSVASKQGLTILAGVIDPEYRGEVLVCFFNTKRQPVEVQAGAKIAQMLLMPTFFVTSFKEVSQLDPSDRESDGFGSSGT